MFDMNDSRGYKRKRTEDSNLPSRRQSGVSHTRSARQHDRSQGWSATEQAQLNKIQEEDRHREFLAKEGTFVLQQKRKAAEIRVKDGRARPIDWLAVNLRIIDPLEDLINDEVKDEDFEYVQPETVIDKLTFDEATQISSDINDFLDLEQKAGNREYWRTMRILVKERQQSSQGRATKSVSKDIDNLLAPKTYDELQKLERQINKKLDSDEPIDTDYWQQLLDSLLVYKAKAKLTKLYSDVLRSKLATLRQKNEKVALQALDRLDSRVADTVKYSKSYDPEPMLDTNGIDKSLVAVDEQEFLHEIATNRQRVAKFGYMSSKRPPAVVSDVPDTSQPLIGIGKKTNSSYDKEVAQGMEEDEEVFAGEEQVETKSAHLWNGKYRPRKPRYFNRVQMGYEWNKYNQTHYDHDNPPPKVVQGYKFHVFYPDLIDPTKAPTYKISREGGRKKGETLAPAGEEDTCIIRFMSGPPYEDIAFRIVDRDWDYSAKHERGFKSTFEKGILTLHFSFKKVYYRK